MLSPVNVEIWPHNRLAAAGFVTHWPQPLGENPRCDALAALLAADAHAPVKANDAIRSAIRDLLREGGFRPNGRAKPSSEYLLRAAADGTLSAINPCVDACNATSLHSGLPISVVDLDRATPPFALGVVAGEVSYVFNASGQEIALHGLLCLHDKIGPCANPVKDAQRTKTDSTTRTTLSIVWGSTATREHTLAATRWYRELVQGLGASTADIRWSGPGSPTAVHL